MHGWVNMLCLIWQCDIIEDVEPLTTVATSS